MDTRLAKYGVALTAPFVLYTADGKTLQRSATFAAGDVKIQKDGGALANVTNLPTDTGDGYSISLTATEMQAARIHIFISDQDATQVWLDTAIYIETYGNASGQHEFDLDTAAVAPDNSGIATLVSRLTSTRATNLDNLDAAVTSRLASASYTAPDNAGITTLTTRLSSGRATNLDNLDATVSSRLSSASYTVPDNTGISTLLSRLTSLRATGLDNLDAAVSSRATPQTVWEYGTRTLSSFGTLIADIWGYATRSLTDKSGFAPTAASIRSEIDTNSTKLDVAVGTRLASASYTAPDNTTIGQIKTRVDLLGTAADIWAYVTRTLTSAGSGGATAQEVWEYSTRSLTDKSGFAPSASSIRAEIDTNSTKLDATVSSRLASASYTAPDNTTVGQIKTRVDLLATAADVWGYITRSLTDKAGFAPTVTQIRTEMDTNSTKLDATVSSRLPTSSYTAPDNTTVGQIKTRVDLLATAADVWGYVTRTLTGATGGGATAQEIWEYPTRTLTSFGSLVSSIWSNVTRTLTSAGAGGATAQEVWEYGNRALTGTGVVNVYSPLNPASGELTLFKGDDYVSRPINFAVSRDYTAATLRFKIGYIGETALAVETDITATLTNVAVTLSKDVTADLQPNKGYYYTLQATMGNGEVITIATGTVAIKAVVL